MHLLLLSFRSTRLEDYSDRQLYSSIKERVCYSQFKNAVSRKTLMPKSNRIEERRCGRRFEVGWELAVKGKDQSGRDFDETGRLENLSSGGAYFYFQKRFKPGAKIEMRIKVPFKNNNWMKYAAQVLRLEQSGEGVGVAVKFNTPRPVFVGA